MRTDFETEDLLEPLELDAGRRSIGARGRGGGGCAESGAGVGAGDGAGSRWVCSAAVGAIEIPPRRQLQRERRLELELPLACRLQATSCTLHVTRYTVHATL